MILLDERAIREFGSCELGMEPNTILHLKVAHAQARAIFEWGEEFCQIPEHSTANNKKRRRRCTYCWLQFKAELKKAEVPELPKE